MAIKAGITIVHINTELRLAWRRGLEQGLKADPDDIAQYRSLPAAVDEVEDTVLARLELFNAWGPAEVNERKPISVI